MGMMHIPDKRSLTLPLTEEGSRSDVKGIIILQALFKKVNN